MQPLLIPLFRPSARPYPARMATITNLNRFRKQQARAAARQQADENAAKFGRSKAEKEAEARAADRARSQLDGHERE